MKIKYFFMLLVALGVSGCATVEGIGKDLEKAGETLQKESRDQSE
ncbi:MAG: entericidin A/B family lipoprotein [Gammaproteobacteria bacterium]|jgi:predicted small secreted protein|nr:entericidin A/B family lipoprotein [Gammaproteobacteria bacterium]